METALRSGLLKANALTRLASSCYERFGPDATPSCDFDGVNGLVKTWIFLGAKRLRNRSWTTSPFQPGYELNIRCSREQAWPTSSSLLSIT